MDVPTFDGDILNWRTFWKRFCIVIHDHTYISNAEKLAYLRHALKDSTAKSTKEGLSHSGDHYAEKVKCLETSYNQPKLIHQAHVKKIIMIQALKDGSGNELHRPHDTVQKYIRALKAMGHESYGTFIISFLLVNIDKTSLFEWQKHDQNFTDVSHYQDLLDFINQSVRLSIKDFKSQNMQVSQEGPSKEAFTFPFCFIHSRSKWQLWTEKHALFTCPEFKSMSREKMISIVRSNKLWLNCLKPGQ